MVTALNRSEVKHVRLMTYDGHEARLNAGPLCFLGFFLKEIPGLVNDHIAIAGWNITIFDRKYIFNPGPFVFLGKIFGEIPGLVKTDHSWLARWLDVPSPF